jgi:hypothetical protein
MFHRCAYKKLGSFRNLFQLFGVFHNARFPVQINSASLPFEIASPYQFLKLL